MQADDVPCASLTCSLEKMLAPTLKELALGQMANLSSLTSKHFISLAFSRPPSLPVLPLKLLYLVLGMLRIDNHFH